MKKYVNKMLSSLDIAVCLHFRAKLKMAARGPKMIASEVNIWACINFLYVIFLPDANKKK